MKLTPSSTTRLSVAMAWSRLGGSPQMPGPVIRMAPNPMRLTVRSPPTSMVPAAAAVGCALTRYLLVSPPASHVLLPRVGAGGREQRLTQRPGLAQCPYFLRCLAGAGGPLDTVTFGLKCFGRA